MPGLVVLGIHELARQLRWLACFRPHRDLLDEALTVVELADETHILNRHFCLRLGR